MNQIALWAALGLGGVAAIYDVISYRIPNWISVALVVLFLLTWGFGSLDAPWLRLGLAACGFAIGFGLFAAGWFGAGDVKLFSGLALLVPPGQIGSYIVWMALSGAVLALLYIVKQSFSSHADTQDRGSAAAEKAAHLPYGVAIAAGAAIALLTGQGV